MVALLRPRALQSRSAARRCAWRRRSSCSGSCRWPEKIDRPFLNSNNYASFVLLLLGPALWRAASGEKGSWNWAALAAALLGAAAASGSRRARRSRCWRRLLCWRLRSAAAGPGAKAVDVGRGARRDWRSPPARCSAASKLWNRLQMATRVGRREIYQARSR